MVEYYNCKHCGKLKASHRKDVKYCSDKCKSREIRKQMRLKQTIPPQKQKLILSLKKYQGLYYLGGGMIVGWLLNYLF
jgi:hypothetical protein